MSTTIAVPLEPKGEIEDFNADDRNVAFVSVQADGRQIASSDCIVDLRLSREAMIGLATELLRAAHRSPEKVFAELLPSQPGFSAERFGIYLHPESCRLHIGEADFGKIDKALKPQEAT